MGNTIDFTTLTERLTRDAARATAARLYFSNRGVRRWLSNVLASDPGDEHSFLADPLFEATFGWKSSGKQWRDLADDWLLPETIDALDYRKSPHRIDRQWSVYTHQLTALQTLLQPQARSLVVSSGTGSGKTECFLIPILESMARQVKQHGQPIEGVQALFLYPLNALINSQQERLSAWMSPFNGKIRYCLYNGETKPRTKEDTPERVLSRQRLRESPPPVLLTNATMLEYMLVRSEDNPILEKSRGQLKWIVLDEAHTYIGSQAAELALLLRRVMIAFGAEPENVRFVATSATIGSDDNDSKNRLREFLADLAGISVEQVVVALGEREIPVLPEPDLTKDQREHHIDSLASMPAPQLYDHLVQSTLAITVRNRLANTPSTIGDLQREAVDRFGNINTSRWLQFLSQCSRAVSTDGQPFLPLRIHLFHRTFDGLWACINPQCPGKPAEITEDSDWRWGSVHTHAVESCPHCNSLALELVRCSECGNEHLKCEQQFNPETGQIRLLPRKDSQQFDEFTLDLATDQWESAGLDTADETDNTPDDASTAITGHPRYLPARFTDSASIQQLAIDNDGRQSENAQQRELLLPDSQFRCSLCNSGVTARRPEGLLFRSARAGMPFYSLIASRNLLRSSPAPHELESRTKERLPADGRKILTFSDSRQGTARLAMSQQQDADRSFVRSQIYHQLAQENNSPPDAEQCAKLEETIAQLEKIADTNDAFADLLQEKKAELAELSYSEPCLPWEEVRARIATSHQLVNGSRRHMNRVNMLPDLSDSEFADFCLYREFIRRPRKGSTLETLGLVALRYPAIEKLATVPADVAARDISLDDWKTLLTQIVNFVFRAGYAVDMPRDWGRWIGERLTPNVVTGPHQDRVKGTIGWPNPQYPRSTVVKLVQKSLQLDLDNETDKQWLTSCLHSAWSTIANTSPRLISNTGEGWQLRLAEGTELYSPSAVWQCPFTGRAFDRVFRGTSPYIPIQLEASLYECNRIEMPALPDPFWAQIEGAQADGAETWLEANDAVKTARDSLLWENHSDLVARYSDWYGTGEHSAQQDSHTLQALTDDFNRGSINILNCSTTMEMGVDIAGISAVMMNNAPPGPANYLQRAGRAGRRSETTAAALTICSASAHGAMLFENPDWPFKTPTTVPRVTLESVDIVQRHVNALLLANFMKPIANPLKTNCEWFFAASGEEHAHCDHFIAGLESTQQVADSLGPAIDRLTRRTVLSSQPLPIMLAATRQSIDRIMKEWRAQIDLLEADLTLLTANDTGPRQPPAARAIEFRLQRIRDEYLLHELANHGFLPGYGFPTDVVSFVTTTVEELRQKASRQSDRIDIRTRSRGYPSRDLPVAIREYAPGADVAIDGRVYTSGGVLLNWHLPPGDSDTREIQALKTYWSCRRCGAGGTTVQSAPQQCPACGANKPASKRFIEPAGFAVELTYQTHNDTTRMQYIPVTAPRLHINDASWSHLATRAAGRIRFSSEGVILHRNPGRNNVGYSICLRCGRAEEQTETDQVANAFTKPHKRLRGGKDPDGNSDCEASHEDFAIIRDHELAHESKTSIAELQLNDSATTAPINDPVLAWSVAVAIRHGLVQTLGLEISEIGIAIQEASSEGGMAMQSIFLYDTTSGGAGYTEHLIHHMPAIAGLARQLLDCRCDSCCHNCLLSYDTQHEVANLNRLVALDFLDNGFMQMLHLPAEYRFFGSQSRSESQPIAQALAAAINKVDSTQIDLYLQGKPEHWHLAEWPFLQTLIRYGSTGGTARMIIPKHTLATLPESQLRVLAGLHYTNGIQLHCIDSLPTREANGALLATCHSVNQQKSWAASDGTALTPTPDWADLNTVLVRGQSALDNTALQPIDIAQLEQSSTSVPAGSVRLAIADQLNVPIENFGETLWQQIFDHAPTLREQMQDRGPIERISYTDQYIHSPLTLRLLAELVVAIPHALITPTTRFTINTVSLESTNNRSRTPTQFFHNWSLDRQRRAVAPQLLTQMGWNGGDVDVLEKRRAPHYRELRLQWPDSAQWTIQLDHGFGPWECTGATRFPFDQGIPLQASIAATLETRLTARNPQFETYVFFDSAVNAS